ncbi:MAG: epoxyqueuosine reductase QueH [Firmicutes bacterium]|nr:epoxyqueuosine reductase QueH [Bacillota bacterium]
MEKINYQNKLLEIVKDFNDEKPTVLLHSCCGPCSTQVIDFLKSYFNITIYYYNPNIEPYEEYLKRKQEQIRFINEYNNKNSDKIKYIDSDYDNESFENFIKGLEREPEGGARCSKCFYLRLKNTALKAKEYDFDYFGTTLTVSPHKNSQVINKIGESISNELDIKFIYGDFKKNDGYKKSIEFSKIYNLYRQDYCGCIYGKDALE